jgi:hypothetical protein
MSHKEEEQGVGRYVEIEVDEAVDEEAATGDQTGELQCAGERMIELSGTV